MADVDKEFRAKIIKFHSFEVEKKIYWNMYSAHEEQNKFHIKIVQNQTEQMFGLALVNTSISKPKNY